jgi:hypothetical protein
VNHASFEYKEEIKVGYNLRRKMILLAIWALCPLIVLASPTVLGRFEHYVGMQGFVHHVSVLWLVLGGAALAFRVLQLCYQRDAQTGIVWAVKIITDPFHDIKIYHRAPLAVLRGELIAPRHGQDHEAEARAVR